MERQKLPAARVRMPGGNSVLARSRRQMQRLMRQGGYGLGMEAKIMLTPTAALNGAELAFLDDRGA